MDRKEVVELMKKISAVYPMFIADKETEQVRQLTNVWVELFEYADNDAVHKKLSSYMLESQWPPKPAEIYVAKKKENETLKRMEQREREHAKVPQHVKDEFKEKLEQLIKDKS